MMQLDHKPQLQALRRWTFWDSAGASSFSSLARLEVFLSSTPFINLCQSEPIVKSEPIVFYFKSFVSPRGCAGLKTKRGPCQLVVNCALRVSLGVLLLFLLLVVDAHQVQDHVGKSCVK